MKAETGFDVLFTAICSWLNQKNTKLLEFETFGSIQTPEGDYALQPIGTSKLKAQLLGTLDLINGVLAKFVPIEQPDEVDNRAVKGQIYKWTGGRGTDETDLHVLVTPYGEIIHVELQTVEIWQQVKPN